MRNYNLARLTMKFFLSQDNDGHWYIVQAARRDDWLTWLEQDEDEEASWEEPDFAERLGGAPDLVEFGEYEIV